MKTKRTLMTLLLVVAILGLGIAYAAMASQALKVAGSATAAPSDTNFDVKFIGTPTTSGAGTTVATIDTATDSTGRTASIDVSGLTIAGQTATAVYTISNESPVNITATLSRVIDHKNADWFDVAADLEKTTLAQGDTTTLTVTVTLKVTPVTVESVSDDITIVVTAAPLQNPVATP